MKRYLWWVMALSACADSAGPVPSDLRFDDVVVGGGHSCAVTATGEAYCWGSGSDGQLGTGGEAAQVSPAQLDPSIAFVSLSAGGEHTCGLDRGGEAWCWGFNGWGQLGISQSGAPQPVPVAIPDDRVWSDLSAGRYHTCGITTDPELLCWGYNNAGQLGHGTHDKVSWPRPVAGEVRALARSVTAGAFHSCALTGEGQAWCWGANSQGQLGDGTTYDRTRPVPVATEERFVEISAGANHTCARSAAGDVYCWGGNEAGQLGHNSVSRPGVPGAVVPGTVARAEVYTSVTAGNGVSCATDQRDVAYCWGEWRYGQIGRVVGGPVQKPADIPGHRFSRVVAGAGTHVCGVERGAGTIRCWGTGPNGELGNASTTFSPVPIPVRFQ